jgi:ketosteroid isomerase-like protein
MNVRDNKPVSGSQSKAHAEIIRAYPTLFDNIDNMRMDAFLAGVTEDIVIVFGNNSPAIGKEQVRNAIGALWQTLDGLKHNFVNVIQQGTCLVLEANVDYVRKDKKVVTIPTVSILLFRGSKVSEWRIYSDIAPIFASGNA